MDAGGDARWNAWSPPLSMLSRLLLHLNLILLLLSYEEITKRIVVARELYEEVVLPKQALLESLQLDVLQKRLTLKQYFLKLV